MRVFEAKAAHIVAHTVVFGRLGCPARVNVVALLAHSRTERMASMQAGVHD